MPSLFVHVQYLKGVGHLRRILFIAEAAAAAGLEVHIASGGLPLKSFVPRGARVHQLPPLQAGPGGFGDLRDAQGDKADAAYHFARRDQLQELFRQIAPDILLIESFPFGRRQLAGELIPLLETARLRRPRPHIVCSLRDILQKESRADRLAETLTRLHDHFDCVLVHGDPAFAMLEESFAHTQEIAPLLHYTGLVAPPEESFQETGNTPRGEVIVSAGGGAVGTALFEAALAARPATVLADLPWRLITGPHMAQGDFDRLAAQAGPDVTVERFRQDFHALLSLARLSISYAGYNTCLDTLRARVPAVLVSFSGDGGETEQTDRAERLSRSGLAATLTDYELTPERLARAIEAALELPPHPDLALDLDGARKTAIILRDLAAKGTA